jgi:thiamine-monophosphate kinase
MKINSEWKLLGLIRERIKDFGVLQPPDITAPLTDDCAVINTCIANALISTDISIENVHFRREWATPFEIGKKAMTGNISDILSMAGIPRFAFVSIGIPRNIDTEYVLSIYDGMLDACDAAGVYISGGDTSSSENIVISITIYGAARGCGPVYRNGAKPGDGIFVTGRPGSSLAGLELLKSGDQDKYPSLTRRHLNPPCRIGLIDLIVNKYAPSAMIDISDGMLSDLGHVAEASKTGYIIELDKLTVEPELLFFCEMTGRTAADYCLASGEEYELLFTSNHALDDSFFDGIPITRIGEITRNGRLLKRGGLIVEKDLHGFDHFKD